MHSALNLRCTKTTLHRLLEGFSFPNLPNILGNNFSMGTSTPVQNSIIMYTSCNNNDGVVCVTDFIPFVRFFKFVRLLLTRCNAPKLNRS